MNCLGCAPNSPNVARALGSSIYVVPFPQLPFNHGRFAGVIATQVASVGVPPSRSAQSMTPPGVVAAGVVGVVRRFRRSLENGQYIFAYLQSSKRKGTFDL